MSERLSAAPPGEGAYALPPPHRRIIRAFRQEGVGPTVSQCANWGLRFLAGPRAAGRARKEPQFSLDGRRYDYVDDWHSWTWLNERAVELPIARAAMAAADPARTIEIGNVTSHYFPARHRIVDKYESAPGVENIDLFEISEREAFDLVLCVSTLEHVGWDEPVRDPVPAVDAVARLMELVAPGGRLLVTIPVGYHPTLANAAIDGTLGFDSVRALRCRYPSLDWHEAVPEAVAAVPYDELIYRASAVLICDWRGPGRQP